MPRENCHAEKKRHSSSNRRHERSSEADRAKRRREHSSQRSSHQSASHTPPRSQVVATSNVQQDGSESVESITNNMHAFNNALLEGIDKIINKSRKDSNLLGLTINQNIISEFNPLDSDLHDWLQSVDEYATINNWTDAVTCHLALGKLRGPAETWYRGLPSRLFTWVEWKALLLKHFESKRNLHELMLNMFTLVPKPQQSLYLYAFEKLSLINKMKLGICDADKVNLIMGGIDNEQIRFSVETAKITDPAQLARHLRTFDDKNRKIITVAPDKQAAGDDKVQQI